MKEQKFIKVSESFFVDADFQQAFAGLGLTSIDSVFSFEGGANLAKKNLAAYRTRLQFETDPPTAVFFLKRYDRPPIVTQLKSWLCHRIGISIAYLELKTSKALSKAGINTPKIIAYGQRRNRLFEERSFIITEKIPNARSLEQKLPDCFCQPASAENIKLQRQFLSQLAGFIKKFHQTGLRHRDLYLCHIFRDENGEFHLIDLARVFRPKLLSGRFRIKDLAQLYYSAPGKYFTHTDRLRFYLDYCGYQKLTLKDKLLIKKVKRKTKRMAAHDARNGKPAPFAA